MENVPEEIIRLMTRNQGAVRNYILSLVLDNNVADDLLQETNVTICRKAAEFTVGTNFLSWACRIAYFNILVFRRSKARDRLQLNESVLDYLAEKQLERSGFEQDRVDALSDCINKLPEPHADLIRRRYKSGGTTNSLAEAESKTPNAMAQLLFRLRSQLEQCVRLKLKETTS